jgi:hypothetical protein
MMNTKKNYSELQVDSQEFNDFNYRMITAMGEVLSMKIKLIEKTYRDNLMSEDVFENSLKRVEHIEQVLIDCSRYRNIIEVKDREIMRLHSINSMILKELKFATDDQQGTN